MRCARPADIEPYVTERRGLFPGRRRCAAGRAASRRSAAILTLATETGTPVVPQGGNTGLVGGQVPDRTGRAIVLSLSRLNRIREIDLLSNTVTVGGRRRPPDRCRRRPTAAGRLFPLSLASQGSCQIGGNLSSNAGGTAVLAYGNARELCLGVEVVLPTGEVLDDLRKLKKDNTGYDLKDLFVGAEGTLGVITAAVLKLFPKPKGREVAWVGLPSPEAALDLLSLALGACRQRADRLRADVGSRRSISRCATSPARAARWPSHLPWHVLMEISSGRSAEDAHGACRGYPVRRLWRQGCVDDAAIAASLAQADAFWRLRETLPEAQTAGRRLDQARHLGARRLDSRPSSSAPAAVAEAVARARASSASAIWATATCTTTSRSRSARDPQAFLALYRPMNQRRARRRARARRLDLGRARHRRS